MTNRSKNLKRWLPAIIAAAILLLIMNNRLLKSPKQITTNDLPEKHIHQPVQPQTQPKMKTPITPQKLSMQRVIASARSWKPVFANWYGQTPPDFTLTDTDGNEHKLSDYRGKQVVIVFWATWCLPCRVEIPHLNELRRTNGQDKLAILAVSNENPELVKSFTNNMNMTYTVLHDNGSLQAPFRFVTGIPASFFIDPDGRIKLATEGVLSLTDLKAILQAEWQ